MKGLYFYRGHCIMSEYGGWTIDICGDYNVYKALKDAKNAIKKYLDSTNDAEPRIIGYMDYSSYTPDNKKAVFYPNH